MPIIKTTMATNKKDGMIDGSQQPKSSIPKGGTPAATEYSVDGMER
jgi:hypothetical protein